MKHINTLSKTTVPARATSLLEWTQLGGIFGVFATAIGALATGFNTLTTALERKGAYDDAE